MRATFRANRPTLSIQDTDHFVERAVHSKAFRGDGPPYWDRAPTLDDAKGCRLALIKRLNRRPFCSEFPNGPALAERMAACRKIAPCGCCPICARAVQRKFVAHGLQHLEPLPGNAVRRFTVVFPTGRVPMGELTASAFVTLRDQFESVITGAREITYLQAGIEVSVDDDTVKGTDEAFHIHLHGTAEVSDKKAFRDRLARAFPNSPTVYRPLSITPCDGSAYALSYALKPSIDRRVAFWAARRQKPCWQIAHRRLSARQHIEIVLALSELGLANRIILAGRK